MNQSIPEDLVRYVEEHILPQYHGFDKAHRLDHAARVIEESLQLAALYKARPVHGLCHCGLSRYGTVRRKGTAPPGFRKNTGGRRLPAPMVHPRAAAGNERGRRRPPGFLRPRAQEPVRQDCGGGRPHHRSGNHTASDRTIRIVALSGNDGRRAVRPVQGTPDRQIRPQRILAAVDTGIQQCRTPGRIPQDPGR